MGETNSTSWERQLRIAADNGQTWHERNKNGKFLVDLYANNDLVIGGTLLAHKTCHKIIWVSPDLQTGNQIDHLLLNRQWKAPL
jgi:hypothetical protein